MSENCTITPPVITRAIANQLGAPQLVLPEGTAAVAAEAFMKRNYIEAVYFPMSLKKLCCRSFAGCFGLKNIQLPSSVTEIEQEAFARCLSLETMVVPASLPTLSGSMLAENTALQSLVFRGSPGMQRIDDMVCQNCRSLRSLTLPFTVESIGQRAFYGCKSLELLQLSPALLYIGDEAFSHCGILRLHLPDGLEYIGDSAFFHCKHLTDVYIPSSVHHLGKWVFHGCNRLKTIELRHDPYHIGEWIINRSTTVRCFKGSAVDAYCAKYGFKTEYIEEDCHENHHESDQ